MKHMIRRRSRAGETIGEGLVALLIASLAATILMGMTSASKKVIDEGEEAIQYYYTNGGMTYGSSGDGNMTVSWSNSSSLSSFGIQYGEAKILNSSDVVYAYQSKLPTPPAEDPDDGTGD